MPHLLSGFKKTIRKGDKTKRPDSDSASITSTAASSLASRSNTDVGDGRQSVEAASSIYSRTTSGYDSHRPSREYGTQGTSQPGLRMSWLDGIVNGPYGYTVEVAEQTAAPNASQKQQTIVTTASLQTSAYSRHTPLPLVNDQDRAGMFVGSLRKSRPHSIYCRPGSTSQPIPRDDPIADLRGLRSGIQMANSLDEIDENEQVIQETRSEIRRLKASDVHSTRNALRMAHEAFEVGSGTLKTLQEQGDRLHNAETNLDQAAIANKDGARKLKELKQANHMIHVDNPFAVERREREADAETLRGGQKDREKSDALRASKWQEWKEKDVHKFTSVPRHQGAKPKDIVARAKYQFEPDSNDEELEQVIEGNLNEIHEVAQKLKGLALAQGGEVERQNEVLDRVRRTVDKVDDGLAANQARLDRFL